MGLTTWVAPVRKVGNAVFVSNISLTDNGKNYYGSYINDDWKVTPKLTVNLGLRWDFFGLVFEHHGEPGQLRARWASDRWPDILDSGGTNASNFSSGCPTCFTDLLATGRHRPDDRQ